MVLDQFVLFGWGLLVGASLVSSSVVRTLAVHNKDVKNIVMSNASNGVFYYMSVHFVVKDNMAAYAGSVLGGLLACLWLARSKNDSIKE